MGVEEAAHGTGEPMAVVDVGAVRVPRLIGEGVVLAVVGDPGDHRPLDRRRAEDRQQPVQPAASLLKLRWVRWRWKPTVIPSPVSSVHPDEEEDVAPVQRLAPDLPGGEADRDERDQRHQPGDDPVACLVRDGLDV